MSKIERTNAAVGKVANIGYADSTAVINDFDAIRPWSEIVEEEKDGNIWVKIPKFYTHYVVENGVLTGREITIEEVTEEGWYLNPIFKRGDKVLEYVYVSKYLLSEIGDTIKSCAGSQPLTRTNVVDLREKVTQLNTEEDEVYLFDIWALQMLQDLFCVEFGTVKGYNVMKGRVYSQYSSNGIYTNGSSENIPYCTGTLSSNDSGYNVMKYRNIENLWGNGIPYVDGVYVKGRELYVNMGGSQNDYVKSDIIVPEKGGNIYQLAVDKNGLLFPVNFDAKGSYEAVLSLNSSLEQAYMYNGRANDKASLFNYNISFQETELVNYSVYRMVRRPR